jgi:hypothetical protein
MTSNDQLEPLAIDELATVTGGYHDPSPSTPDTGIAGLNPAPCTPQPQPRPSPSVVWVPI